MTPDLNLDPRCVALPRGLLHSPHPGGCPRPSGAPRSSRPCQPDVRPGPAGPSSAQTDGEGRAGGGDDSGPRDGREAESFVQMTSPGREGGRGPAPGTGGLAGSPAGAGRGGARAGTPGSHARPRRKARSRARRRGAGSTRLRRRLAEDAALPSAPEAAASILLRPCILITTALIFMSRDSRGTAGCHFPRPRTPAPLFSG